MEAAMWTPETGWESADAGEREVFRLGPVEVFDLRSNVFCDLLGTHEDHDEAAITGRGLVSTKCIDNQFGGFRRTIVWLRRDPPWAIARIGRDDRLPVTVSIERASDPSDLPGMVLTQPGQRAQSLHWPPEIEPDQLDHLALVLPQAAFDGLAQQLSAGPCTLEWTGDIAAQTNTSPETGRFDVDWPSEVDAPRVLANVTERQRLNVTSGAPACNEQTLRREWFEARVKRAIRREWRKAITRENALSDVAVVVRECVRPLVRRALKEDWPDEQIDTAICSIRERIGRFRAPRLPVVEGASAGTARTHRNRPPRRRRRPKQAGFSLGVVGIPPILHDRWSLGDPDLAEFACERPRVPSDRWDRRLLNALLCNESGQTLNDLFTSNHGLDMTAIWLLCPPANCDRSVRAHPDWTALERLKAAQERSRVLRPVVGAAVLAGLLGAAFGVAYAGAVGALVGGAAAVVLGILAGVGRIMKNELKIVEDSRYRLAIAMQKAVHHAASDKVSWRDIRRVMEEAGELGACWPETAWEIAIRRSARPSAQQDVTP
jgi:hypothetical protein